MKIINHLQIDATYMPKYYQFERMTEQGSQFAVVLSVLKKSPALIFNFAPCHKNQSVLYVEKPIIKDGHIQFVIQLIAIN